MDRQLPLNVVDLWFATLPEAGFPLESVLSDEEMRRAQRFRFQRDAAHFVARHGILRLVLASYTGVPPVQLSFTHNQYGKPVLDGRFSDLRFSMSQSGELAVYAISRLRDVGVDVEHLQQKSLDIGSIARSFFSAKQVAALDHAPADQKEEAFLRLWTELEAWAKALGSGIGTIDSASSGWRGIPGKCFSFKRAAPDPGYVVAVAVQGRRRCSLRIADFRVTPAHGS